MPQKFTTIIAAYFGVIVFLFVVVGGIFAVGRGPEVSELSRERVRLEGEKGWTTPQWAYKTENIYDQFHKETLSRLGKEGWEMVTARRAIDRSGTPNTECIFKRQR